jgi:hypothetical protein
MKLPAKLILFILFILSPLSAFSQNWMMAQQYAIAALDSVYASKDDDAIYFADFKYSHFIYKADKQEYEIYLTDNLQDSSYMSMIIVDLRGGLATFVNDDFDFFETQIPDWSDCVFVWNATGKKISFALSCNDSEFSAYSLDDNKFQRFLCSSTEAVYIKISTMVNGSETAQVHYKLIKGKGYKVQWDSTNSKFEVYADDRVKL